MSSFAFWENWTVLDASFFLSGFLYSFFLIFFFLWLCILKVHLCVLYFYFYFLISPGIGYLYLPFSLRPPTPKHLISFLIHHHCFHSFSLDRSLTVLFHCKWPFLFVSSCVAVSMNILKIAGESLFILSSILYKLFSHHVPLTNAFFLINIHFYTSVMLSSIEFDTIKSLLLQITWPVEFISFQYEMYLTCFPLLNKSL